MSFGLRRSIVCAVLMCGGLAGALAQDQPQLQILVIGGEGSINNVKQRVAREPIVEVRDQNNRPVAGAVVLFEAPGSGPSGAFVGGTRALRVTTDVQGRALGQGFQPNTVTGDFNVQVTANYQGSTARTVIHMRNVGGGGTNVAKAAGHGKLIGILIGVGAAAAAGTVLGLHAANNGNGTAVITPQTTIAAGTGTVGARP